MKTLYLYVPNQDVDTHTKYGIKLSEHANTVINIGNTQKRGIIAFLSPMDSNLYNDVNYTCLKVSANKLNIFVYDNTSFNLTKDKSFICDLKNYEVGTFEDPQALICSTILPENIDIYNKTIDIPLLIENSKEFYYKKAIYNMLDGDFFTSFEIYQLLLILGQKKKHFKIKEIDNKLKIYIDKKSNKKYTKKSNF